MKRNETQTDFRQDEIREILGVIPPRIIRWGSVVLSLVFILLIAGASWFKYPDRISGQLGVFSGTPPVLFNARQSGRIELLAVCDSSQVKTGQLLAVIESSANFMDILELDSLMNCQKEALLHPESPAISSFPEKEYRLGQWQQYLAAFVKARTELLDYERNGSAQARIQSLRNQRKDNVLLYELQLKQQNIKEKEMEIQERQYSRTVLLRDSGSISAKEFESGVSQFLKAKFELESMRSLLAQTQITIDRIDHEILSLGKEEVEIRGQKHVFLNQAYDQLTGAIAEWKMNFAFVAPLDGKIVFTRIWSPQQHVLAGERVLTLIADAGGPLTGKALLPIRGAGKVKVEQKVIVRFDKFPYMEYGSVMGHVKNISQVAEKEFYSLEVSFPNGLQSTYGLNIPFTEGMTGQAEVITEKLSLLVRIVKPLKNLLLQNHALSN